MSSPSRLCPAVWPEWSGASLPANKAGAAAAGALHCTPHARLPSLFPTRLIVTSAPHQLLANTSRIAFKSSVIPGGDSLD